MMSLEEAIVYVETVAKANESLVSNYEADKIRAEIHRQIAALLYELKERRDVDIQQRREDKKMNKYDIKIVVASSEGASYFDRSANIQCARAVEQGYRLHSASPLNVQVGETGKALYSQTFIFEKGDKS